MGVFAGGAPDFRAISGAMSEVTSLWMNGEIQILDPNLEGMTWNEWTNEMTGSPIVLWTGRARIQPIRSADYRQPEVGFASASIRRVRFQVPLDDTRDYVRPGFQVKVTDGAMFPDLTELNYVIRTAFNSSYAWLTTVECEVDAKN